MNLSGSKGQPERETKVKSERATEEKVCVCVRLRQVGYVQVERRASSALLRDSAALC